MNVVIIEDEKPALSRLTKILQEVDEQIQIIATADSIISACEIFKSNPQIDLALMDIELADGQSFEIFKMVEVKCPVIFTTAYDEFAIKAFKVNSIDYLLKPINADDLKQSLRKFNQVHSQASSTINQVKNMLLELNQPAPYKTRFLIKTGNKMLSIATSELGYFLAAEKLVYAISANSPSKHVVDFTLDELENMLNPKDFFRINRHCLAQVTAIKTVHSYFNGKLKVELWPKPEEEIIVSREKASEFKKWLNS